MSIRFAIMTALAAGHLLLVVASAAHIHLYSPQTASGHLLDGYAALSGADNSFGFFAPGVAPQFAVKFTLTDDTGRTWEETAEQGTTREANLRFDSMASMFMFGKLREPVAASWSAALFGRYPHVRQIEVLSEAEDMPTMDAYRHDCRPEWDTVYAESFTRAGSKRATPQFAVTKLPISR